MKRIVLLSGIVLAGILLATAMMISPAAASPDNVRCRICFLIKSGKS